MTSCIVEAQTSLLPPSNFALPVLHAQRLDARELTHVSRNKSQPARAGLTRDEHVISTDRSALSRQRRTNCTGAARIVLIERQNLETQLINNG